MKKYLSLVCTLLLAPALPAGELKVDPAVPAYKPAAPLTGKFSVAGTDTMEGVLKSWIQILQQGQPEIAISYSVAGKSGFAASSLAKGTAQVAFMGRTLTPEEAAKMQAAFGYSPLFLTVAGGSHDLPASANTEVVWVHPDNPLQRVTLAQLDAVYSTTRKRGAPKPITTWGQLGLTGEWADKPIHALMYGYPTPESKVLTVLPDWEKEFVLLNGEWSKDIKLLSAQTTITDGVLKDRYSLGFAGMPYGMNTPARQVAVAADAGGPFYQPTLENVASRKYPLGRLVYMYVNKPPGQPLDPAIKEFLRAVLSAQGQAAAWGEKFLPLPADMIRPELAKLDSN